MKISDHAKKIIRNNTNNIIEFTSRYLWIYCEYGYGKIYNGEIVNLCKSSGCREYKCFHYLYKGDIDIYYTYTYCYIFSIGVSI